MTSPAFSGAFAAHIEQSARLLERYHAGWRLEYLDEIDSTSSEARRRVESRSATEPFLLVAGHQTAGRGRADRPWVAPAGTALLMTAAVPPARLASGRGGLGVPQAGYPTTLWPLQMALSVALKLRLFGWQAKLKWPNDVLIDNRKAAGLLLELVDGWLLVGVGVNLLQREQDFACVRDAKFPPTSLAIEAPGRSEEDILALVPSLIHAIVSAAEAPWPPQRMLNWYRNWCTSLGTQVAFDREGPIAGLATGIDDLGRLQVRTEADEVLTLSQEVVERR